MPPQNSAERHRAYWRCNLRYVVVLLSIWFAVSYGCGILFVDELDRIRVGGFKLGLWCRNAGAISWSGCASPAAPEKGTTSRRDPVPRLLARAHRDFAESLQVR